MLEKWQSQLLSIASEEKAAVLRRFFKTGPGEYGYGDVFIGLTVPQVRATAKSFSKAPLPVIAGMLHSPEHEFRLSALLTLVEQYRTSKSESEREEIVQFYLSHTGSINNWDLVDLSAPKIVGLHILRHPEKSALLYSLADTAHLWSQRIAIISTLPLIKADKYTHTLALAEKFLTHPHQLMHKATGWMLREAGKRSLPALTAFLDTHAPHMPRTMLRYAIEKLPDTQRRYYMAL